MPALRSNAILLSLSLILVACDKPAAGKAGQKESMDAATEAVTLARTPSPEGARVFFISPATGDTVSNPIRIEFGIDGMSVAKAGDEQPNSGHHHLLIDADLPDLGLPIPASANYVHFGDGSSSTEISLKPGTHSLRLLLGDHRHIPHDPPVASDPIVITVE